MSLTINLPDRDTVLALNRQRWAEVVADPKWNDLPGRIETNQDGQIIVNPPPSFSHIRRQGFITQQLSSLLSGGITTECPVITSDGVKAIDVAWLSDQRLVQVSDQLAIEIAPEICVEVLSPGDTAGEMQAERQLYFDAGAIECWTCDLDGQMAYDHAGDPQVPSSPSKLCPNFPSPIEA